MFDFIPSTQIRAALYYVLKGRSSIPYPAGELADLHTKGIPEDLPCATRSRSIPLWESQLD